jgi:metal-responsive CopG/Arc/MetJ family transcriptional regulator
MNRTQIYLPEEQTKRLDERASTEGVTRSALIRRAVDEYIAREDRDPAGWRARWREAVERTAGIAAYLPDGADYVESLREVDARRLRELEP